MKKTNIEFKEIKLVGVLTRTCNASEMSPLKAKIGKTIERFLTLYQDKIKNRKNPGKLFAVYTDYESDEKGEYTYFFGEEVTSFEQVEGGLYTFTIPVQSYTKFTTDSGKMPNVVIDAWKKIWKMTKPELDGLRSYVADFEIYDAKSEDPNNAIVDIYIGIKK